MQKLFKLSAALLLINWTMNLPTVSAFSEGGGKKVPSNSVKSDLRAKASSDVRGSASSDSATSDLQESSLSYLLFDVEQVASFSLKPKPQLTAPDSKLFKYNTSPSNPDHHCYEIKKSLTQNYQFIFNFLSSQKYQSADGH
ncbi:MAG: hypothetical protein ACE5HS_13400 [bacterium]